MSLLFDFFQHLPDYLQVWAIDYGAGLYLILFLIIFAETGLVITPFLPGDSLLFATGALLSMQLPNLDLGWMIIVLIAAAVLGDSVNYQVGKWMAPRLFRNQKSKLLNPRYLERAQEFYLRHGGKTVILARFLPILRTYTPFVTGMSGMPFNKFFIFSFAGGALWISSFICLGYFFGNLPGIKSNFHYVIMGIIAFSVAPIAFEIFKGWRKSRVAGPA